MLRKTLIGLAASLALAAGSSSAFAQVGTVFTYQGQLKNSGAVVNTATDMQFSLWNDPVLSAPANQVGSTITQTNVTVNQGLFTTGLEFGVNPYTADQALWLQIAVRNPAGSGSYVTMGARQKLTPAPFSLATRGLNVDASGRVKIENTALGANPEIFQVRAGPGFQGWFGTSDGSDFTRMFFGVTAANAGKGTIQPESPGVAWRDLQLCPNGGNVLLSPNAQGNVGIGTSTPESALQVAGIVNSLPTTGGVHMGLDSPNGAAIVELVGPNGFAGIDFHGGLSQGNFGGRLLYSGADDTLRVEGVSILSVDGFVGIGTNLPNRKLEVVHDLYGISHRSSDGASDITTYVDSNGGWIGTVNNKPLYFFSGDSLPQVSLLPNGNFGIGVLVPTQRLHVNGNILATGTITPSCAKLKENVVPMSDALDRIAGLNAVRFDWIAGEAKTRGFTHDLGFIAEDVAQAFPEIVFRDEKGEIMGLDYSRMSAVAVGAIKQLKAEGDLKDSQIAELKARLEKIEALLAAQAANDAK